MASTKKIRVYDNIIPVDPLLLFLHVCVLKKSNRELKHYMAFELPPYPLGFFENG